MKNRKVLNLRTHIAGVLALTSYDEKKHQADMELTAVGVLIRSLKGIKQNILVPFPNIVEARLAEEDDNTDPTPRGPGRPPKAQAA